MSKPLLHTQTGGTSFLSFLLLAAGLAAILFQILILANPVVEGEDSHLLTKFLVGGLGLVFILLFFMTSRKGWLEIHQEKIQGKIAGGKTYEFPLEQVGRVALEGRGVHFKGSAGKTIVLDKTPRNRLAPGLVWMLKTYPEINTDQWNENSTSPKMPTALRLFYDENRPVFGDRGFIFAFGSEKYFFPNTTTTPIPPQKGEGNNNDLSPYANQIETIPRFEPDPSKLPLEAILSSIKEDQEVLLQQLVEGHGGMELKEIEPEKYEGDIPGWRAEITSQQTPL